MEDLDIAELEELDSADELEELGTAPDLQELLASDAEPLLPESPAEIAWPEGTEQSENENNIYVIGDSKRLVVRSFLQSLKDIELKVRVLEPDMTFIAQLPAAKIHVILCIDSNFSNSVMDEIVDRVWRYGMHLYVIGKLEDFGVELQRKTRQLPMTVFPSWPISMEQLQRAIFKNSQERKRILVVDADPMMHKIVQAVLGASYEVSLADSGFAAIDHLREHETDLVLLNLELPGMTGLDVLDLIRRDARLCRQAVIILSAKADRSLVLSAMELHPNGYILKTSGPDAIRQGVNNYFARL